MADKPNYGVDTASLREDLTSTMRSMRDTLAFSFQQLNLTLASMNNTIRNVTPNFSNPINPHISNFMPSGNPMYLGSMSSPMAQYHSSAGLIDTMLGRKPYNVSPMEFYRERERNANYMMGTLSAGLGYDAANTAVTFGSMGMTSAILRHAAPKLATGISGLALPMLGSLGASMVMAPIFGAMEKEGEQYGMNMYTSQRLGGRMMGRSMAFSESQQIAKHLSTAHVGEFNVTDWDSTRLGAQGYRDLAFTGMAAGMFQGKSPKEFTKQLEDAAKLVRVLTGVMQSSDIRESVNALMQMRSMGANPLTNTGFFTNLGRFAYGAGQVSGVSAGQMWQLGMGAGQAVQGMGTPGVAGVGWGMHGYAQALNFQRNGMLSDADLSLMGGPEGAAMRYAQGRASIGQSPAFGRMLIAAMMGKDGNLDPATRISGGYFGVMGRATQNMMRPGAYAQMEANMPALQAQLAAGGSEDLYATMRSAINPIIDASGVRGRNGRLSVATNVLSGMGIDMQTAKMMATEIMYPEYGRQLRMQIGAETGAGEDAAVRRRYGLVHRGMSALDFIPRTVERAYQNTIGAAGRGIRDFWGNVTGEADEARIRDWKIASSQPFDYVKLRRSPEYSMSGGELRDTDLDSFYGKAFFGSGKYAPMLEAHQANNQYKGFYDIVRQKTGSENMYAALGGIGLDYTSRGDIESDFKAYRNRVGGGAEFVADKVGRDKLTENVGMGYTDARRILANAGVNLSNEIGTIEHHGLAKLKAQGYSDKEARRVLVAYAKTAEGPNKGLAKLSAETVIVGGGDNDKYMHAAAVAEKQLQDKTALGRFMSGGADGIFDPAKAAGAIEATGLSRELLATMGKLSADDRSKIAEALGTSDISSIDWTFQKGGSGVDALGALLKDTSLSPTAIKLVESLQGVKHKYAGMSSGQIGDILAQGIGAATTGIESVKALNTAQQVFGMTKVEAERFVQAMTSGNIQDMEKIAMRSASPFLKEAFDSEAMAAGREWLASEDTPASVADIAKAKSLGLNFGANVTKKELGELAVGSAINLAQTDARNTQVGNLDRIENALVPCADGIPALRVVLSTSPIVEVKTEASETRKNMPSVPGTPTVPGKQQGSGNSQAPVDPELKHDA